MGKNKEKGEGVVLHVVFKNSGACHQFNVDKIESATAVLQSFRNGITGIVGVDEDTAINLADVSAMSLEDKCK